MDVGGDSRMSGWQRIGVVISIIWLVAVPIYLMVSTRTIGQVNYTETVLAALISGFGPGGYQNNSTEFDAAKQRYGSPR